MLESKKHVFWQALLSALLIFFLGFIFGMYLEGLKTDAASSLAYQSETYLIDIMTQNTLINSADISCEDLKKSNIDFADRIYYEARQLEQFDDSNKITSSIKEVHRKYDLLRTILWLNTISIKERCSNINSVVYLYTYDAQEVSIKAKQITWARILSDLKETQGDNVLLIPIAVNSNVGSLDFILSEYNVTSYPSVIINEKHIIYDLESEDSLGKYLS